MRIETTYTEDDDEKEEFYIETKEPIGVAQDHFLNQLSRANYLGGGSYQPTTINSKDGKSKLYCCVNVYQMGAIDGASSKFTCKIRLYLLWALDFEEHKYDIKDKYIGRVEASEYCSLSDAEVEEFMEEYSHLMPTIKLFNAVDMEMDGGHSLRLYGGQHGGFIMWNYGFRATFKETFEFRQFPFDKQTMSVHLQQDNSANWDKFDLTVCSVLFHYDAVDQAEFTVLTPNVERGSPQHKSSIIRLFVQRKSIYYILNMFSVLAIVTCFAFVCFLVPIEDIADRINIILTLMLTQVAFKFITVGTVPRVGYNTHLDTFCFLSLFFLMVTALLCAYQILWPTHLTNAAAAFIDVIIYASILGIWYICVLITPNDSDVSHTSKPIKLTKGRNWYCFNFANPKFMKNLY